MGFFPECIVTSKNANPTKHLWNKMCGPSYTEEHAQATLSTVIPQESADDNPLTYRKGQGSPPAGAQEMMEQGPDTSGHSGQLCSLQE